MASTSNRYFDRQAAFWDANPSKLERAQKTAEQIRALKLTQRERLIDYGCGTGLLGLQLTDYFEQVCLVDSSAEMLQVAQQKISRNQIDNAQVCQAQKLSDIPFKASAISCLMVLHHIHDLATFFREAWERLSPQGVMIIADLYAEDGSFHQDVAGFSGHNGFDTEKLSEIMTNSRLEVVTCHHYYSISKADKNGENREYPVFILVAQRHN